jgi:hypothetical protein
MAWTSGLQELANRNKFIENLLKAGYDVDFINSHLVVFGVPYLSGTGSLEHFDMISTLDLREGYTIDRPSDHKVWVNGGVPYNIDGRPVAMNAGHEIHVVSETITGTQFLSSKPARGYYDTIEEKITQYLDLIVTPAKHKFPSATIRRALETQRQTRPSPLRFPDSLSARDGVVELSHKLLGKKIGVVGCGGTGSYIVDFLAKTHVAEIGLFDDDVVHVHTLFRLPGVYGDKHLGMRKVDALADVYSAFHEGIVPRPQRVTAATVSDLKALDYVFVAVDDGPSRQLICDACSGFGIPFVDVGMGLSKGTHGLFGFVRTSGGQRGDFTILAGTPLLPAENPVDHEYRRQPQIAELNALNAAIAVIRFKQHYGYFDRLSPATATVFDIAAFEMDSYFPQDSVSRH